MPGIGHRHAPGQGPGGGIDFLKRVGAAAGNISPITDDEHALGRGARGQRNRTQQGPVARIQHHHLGGFAHRHPHSSIGGHGERGGLFADRHFPAPLEADRIEGRHRSVIGVNRKNRGARRIQSDRAAAERAARRQRPMDDLNHRGLGNLGVAHAAGAHLNHLPARSGEAMPHRAGGRERRQRGAIAKIPGVLQRDAFGGELAHRQRRLLALDARLIRREDHIVRGDGPPRGETQETGGADVAIAHPVTHRFRIQQELVGGIWIEGRHRHEIHQAAEMRNGYRNRLRRTRLLQAETRWPQAGGVEEVGKGQADAGGPGHVGRAHHRPGIHQAWRHLIGPIEGREIEPAAHVVVGGDRDQRADRREEGVIVTGRLLGLHPVHLHGLARRQRPAG